MLHAYQSAGEVDASIAGVGAVDPLGFGELEESMALHVVAVGDHAHGKRSFKQACREWSNYGRCVA